MLKSWQNLLLKGWFSMGNRNTTELKDKVMELERCVFMLTSLVEKSSENGVRHDMPFYMKHLLSIDEAAVYFSHYNDQPIFSKPISMPLFSLPSDQNSLPPF